MRGLQDRRDSVVEQLDVPGGQRLLGNDLAKLVVVIVERIGRGFVDAVHHAEQVRLDLLDLGLGQEPAGRICPRIEREMLDPQRLLLVA